MTTLNDNRLVSLTKEQGYIHLADSDWTPVRLDQGLPMQLTALPFKVQLFKLVATDGDIDWVISNHPEGTMTVHALQHENAVRWDIQQFHRELNQLTGTQKCECRTARSQRNPLACCYHAWLSLKVKAPQLGKTL